MVIFIGANINGGDSMKKVYLSLVFGVVFVISGCSGSTSDGESSATNSEEASSSISSPSPTASVTPESESSMTTQPSTMTIEQAKDYYLDWICWSNESLDKLGSLAKGKSQSELFSDSFMKQARKAAKVQRETALALDAPNIGWPEDVVEPISGVVDSILKDVSSLNAIADAENLTEFSYQYNELANSSNSSAQKVRLRLGLPSADSRDDGCSGRDQKPVVP